MPPKENSLLSIRHKLHLENHGQKSLGPLKSFWEYKLQSITPEKLWEKGE